MKPAPQRGYIDNRPVVWIFLILGTVGYLQYRYVRTGEGPLELLGRVSSMTWWFLAALAGVLVAGGLTATMLGGTAGRNELHRIPVGESTVITLRELSVQVVGGILGASGLVSVGFGLGGQGWGWWIVAAAGVTLCAAGAGIAGRGRRWVLAKDRIQIESLWYWMRTPEESWALDETRPPHLALEERRSGGAFGQPVTEEYRVLLDERLLYTASNRELAAAFAQAARQAYPEASFTEGPR